MTTTVKRDLQPKTGTISAKVSVKGISVSLGAGTGSPPPAVTGIVGHGFQVSAPETATIGALEYAFDHWSDGGAANHSVTVTTAPKNLVATYRLTTVLPYDDIGTSKFAEDIIWLKDQGITTGCSATSFCPNGAVTRAQMATFLARAMDLPDATKDYFTDDETSHHEKNINKIAEAGITLGCTPTTFCPERQVTRAQLASFLARALDLPETATDYFTDDETQPPRGQHQPAARRRHHPRLLPHHVLPVVRGHARPDGRVPAPRVRGLMVPGRACG